MQNTAHIQTIRRFNRFYTQRIGAHTDTYLKTPYSLAELRILYELAENPDSTATQLAERLNMDHGFLSRKLTGLTRKKLIKRTQSMTDKRQHHLSLTPQALKEQPQLQRAADELVEQMLAPIPPERHLTLVSAMETVTNILRNDAATPIVFRQLQGGDAGWIVHRHGSVIAKEFGWNMEFEAMCSQIMADFIKNYKPDCERSWIVERGEEILGSLFLIRENETTARLRLLYVEKAARGLGLATKLLEKSFAFARSKNYKRVILFTTSNNVGARRIYEKIGMQLVKEEPFDFAGQMQMGETWAIDL